MPVPDRCPECGADRPAGALKGACPRCLFRLGLDGEVLSLFPGGLPPATMLFTPGSEGSSFLATIAATVGPVPRLLLRDTDTGLEPPLVKPDTYELPDSSSRYQLLGEIARGGMGAVLKGRDTDLGRDLAVKVPLDAHRDKPELVRRFVEEAQIGGQLQHPGIVPVYELGTFADRRPYFTMKLVKGRTLTELLAARSDAACELPRFLGIFEQVCQTVAYAHARKVIHRDLKPSNIMVGSFGEVQVMDWGLAKVLGAGGLADDELPSRRPPEGIIRTVRSGSDADASQAGSVLGTPQYMAQEQAQGEIDWLDERADVFGLGAILCEILTGQPPYFGRTAGEVQQMAARADLGDALRRLESCGADVELQALARRCLAVASRLRSWKRDRDLAGVRDPDALARLARDEQTAWRALWADYESMLRGAEGGSSPARATPRAEPGDRNGR